MALVASFNSVIMTHKAHPQVVDIQVSFPCVDLQQRGQHENQLGKCTYSLIILCMHARMISISQGISWKIIISPQVSIQPMYAAIFHFLKISEYLAKLGEIHRC